MRTNDVLIDYESVQSLELQQPHFHIRVFLGPNNTKLPIDLVVCIHRFHDRSEYAQLDTPGTNELYLGGAYSIFMLASLLKGMNN
ncbi:hypothetical protein [Pseudomonas boanensis]|uniref:hypothetical protein n=1 Tax=Metapseudomonas boanensis TaxID=2822138 RepID=UPI0035D45BAA